MYTKCNTNPIPASHVESNTHCFQITNNKKNKSQKGNIYMNNTKKNELITLRCSKELKDTLSSMAKHNNQNLSTFILNTVTDTVKNKRSTVSIASKQEILEELNYVTKSCKNNLELHTSLLNISKRVLEEL